MEDDIPYTVDEKVETNVSPARIHPIDSGWDPVFYECTRLGDTSLLRCPYFVRMSGEIVFMKNEKVLSENGPKGFRGSKDVELPTRFWTG